MSNDSGEWLLERIEEQLRSEWEDYKEIYANSKGATYEESFVDLLTSYFGGLYDVNTRVAVIDPELLCFDMFDYQQGNDELDIVASFTNSKPRVVFETGEGAGTLRWVPYKAVAAVCEVKSQLQKQSLIDDLDKLENLSLLDDTLDQRLGMHLGGDYTIEEPVKCLIYNEASIADETLEDVLSKNKEAWHALLIVDEGTLILNSNLPFADIFVPSTQAFAESTEIPQEVVEEAMEHMKAHPDMESPDIDMNPDMVSVDKGLLWFLMTISATIPDPFSVNTANSLAALAGNRVFYTGAKTTFEEDIE